MNRTYNFIEIKSTSLRASTGRTDLLKLTGHTNLRPSTVHIGLLKSTGRTDLQELTERKVKRTYMFTRINRGQRFTTLTGHTGLLNFRYW